MKKNLNSAATAGVVIGNSAYPAGTRAPLAAGVAEIADMHRSAHLSMFAGAGAEISGNWSVGVPQAARFRRAECASVSFSRYRVRTR